MTKKSLLTYGPFLLVILPVLTISLWHIHNQGWPSYDAAEYMKTAYQQYLAFRDGSLSDGFKSLYQVRGWRPILFPVFATPFLLLFKGNILAATASTMIICFLICQIYLYAIARLYLDSLRASLVAAFVGSCPMNIYLGTILYSETVWLALFAGFIFHLLKSDNFHKSFHATVAGILLGLAALVRPAETAAIVILPLIGMVALAWIRKAFTFKGAFCVLGFVFLSAGLLIASAFIRQMDYRFVLGAGMMIILAQIILIRENKKEKTGIAGFNYFAVSFMTINLLWWADSMPGLIAWAYDNSFGSFALYQINDLYILQEGPFSFFVLLFLMYLFPQSVFAALLGLVLLIPGFRVNATRMKRLGILGMITLGLLIPICFLYVYTATNEPRRIFIGMSFLSLLLVTWSLQDGYARRIRDGGVTLMVVILFFGGICFATGNMPPVASLRMTQYYQQALPKRYPDQNEPVMSRLRDLGVPERSIVAVYPVALFQPDQRVYEPSALKLASLTTGSHILIVPFWEIGGYEEGIKMLRKNGVSFVLMDIHNDPGNTPVDQQSVQFATGLLAHIGGPSRESYGLQRVAFFKLNEREQVLYRILP